MKTIALLLVLFCSGCVTPALIDRAKERDGYTLDEKDHGKIYHPQFLLLLPLSVPLDIACAPFIAASYFKDK